MALAAFDTLEFVDELEQAGIPDKQARAISSAVRKSHESLDVATKADIADLRRDISAVEERTDAKLEKLETGLRGEMEKLGSDLRHEIGEMRQESRHEIGELRQEMRHEIGNLHKDNESLRKDMAAMEYRFNARFDKLWLQLLVSLSGVVVVALGVFASFPKFFGR